MKNIINILFFVLLSLILLTGCSCGRINSNNEKYEEKLYKEKVEEFFDALKNDDVIGIKSLFSEYVIENDQDLEDKINRLINFYSKYETEFIFTGLTSEGLIEDGKKQRMASSVFPIINNNVYYWIYFDYVYVDEFNSFNIGIKQINFYTIDEYYMFYYSGDKLIENIGLNLCIENDLKEDIICINTHPYMYKSTENKLKFEDIIEYLKNNRDINNFILTFGDYNCKDSTFDSYYYEVLYNNEIVYLELYCENTQIIDASLYNDREFIKKVL